MKTLKASRLLVFLVAAAVLFSLLPIAPAYAADSINYVALGDSVPAGYAPDPAPDNKMDSYVDYLSALLEGDGYTVNTLNIAISGLTTSTLLSQLDSLSAADLAALKAADLITLNIGGNNVLGPTIGLVTDIAAGLGITDFTQASMLQLMQLLTAITNFTPTEEQLAAFDAGVVTFTEEFTQIIGFLTAAAPDAQIIVSTIYNPIPPTLPAFYDLATVYIPAMNQVIKAGKGYTVVDTYTAFADAPDGASYTNVNLSPTSPSVDIHPNAEGHKLMAELHFAAYAGSGPSDGSEGENVTAPGTGSFADTEGEWMDEAVRFWVERGVITGIGNNLFAPNRQVKRAEFMTILINALGLTRDDMVLDVEQFSDVPEGVFYYEAALIARGLGIVSGVGDNKFNPEANITRQDMFTMLYKTMDALNLLRLDYSPPDDNFGDWDDVSDYALTALKYLVGIGVISGKDGKLDPLGTATRAESAVILYNLVIEGELIIEPSTT